MSVLSSADSDVFLSCVLATLVGLLCIVLWFLPKGKALGASVLPHGILPAPGSIPLIGHMLRIAANEHRFNEWMTEVDSQVHGKTWFFSIPFSMSLVITSNPSNIEHFLRKNFDNYVKGREIYDRFHPLLGDGIFNVDGEKWRFQRKTVVKVFADGRYQRKMQESFAAKLQGLMEVLHKAADAGETVDLHKLLHRLVLDAWCNLAFGVDLNLMRSSTPLAFEEAFESMQILTSLRFFIPCWPLFELLSGHKRKIQRHKKTIDEFCADLIEKRLAAGSSGATSNDMLGLFIELLEVESPDGGAGRDLLTSPETKRYLQDIVINLIIAGRDTTAQAMSWAIYFLTQNPHAEKKLLEEAHAVLDSPTAPEANSAESSSDDKPVLNAKSPESHQSAHTKEPSSTPEFEKLKKLVYARAVFNESLRLQPPIPRNVKVAVSDDVLPDGTVLCKGTHVMWSIYTMGRSTALWGEDAGEFKPERWLQPGSSQPSPYVFPAFNGGPRVCLGKAQAESEATVGLAHLISRFKFEVVPGHKVVAPLNVTTPMKHGLMVTVQHHY